MSASQYLINLGILALVLATGLGTRRLTARRILLPVVIAGGFGVAYLTGMPTAGNDLPLELAGLAAGVLLGLAAALCVKVHRDGAGHLFTTAGLGYILIWGAALLGRCAFAYGAENWFPAAIRDFSISYQITGADAWTCAFVLMALSMVVTRVLVTVARGAFTRRPEHALAA